MSRIIVVISVLVIGFASQLSAQARTLTVSSERGSCQACRLILDAGPVIGRADDSVSPTRFTSVVKRRDGKFVVAPMDMPGVMGLYSSDGRLERLMGRPGSGPGEFSTILHVDADHLDTLYVFDSRRISVLSPSAELVRTYPLLFTDNQSVARLKNGNFAVGPINGLKRDLGKITIATSRGAPESSSFQTATDVPLDIFSAYRWVAAASDGGVWVAHFNKYLVERYDLSGKLQFALTREASWFKEWTTPPQRPDRFPQPPELVAIWEDAARAQLWIAITLASTNHKVESNPALGQPNELAKYLDVIFEVFDLRTNTLYYTTRVANRVLFPVKGQQYLLERVSSADANTLIRTITPRLNSGG